MILKRKEAGEVAFKPAPCQDEGWESDSQDLPSMRCVTASLPQLHTLLLHPCSATLCWMGSESGIGSAPPHPMGRSAVLQWGLQMRSAVLLQMRRGWGPCWSLLPMQKQKCLLGSAGPGAVCCCNTELEEDSNLRGQEGASCCTDTYMEIIW